MKYSVSATSGFGQAHFENGVASLLCTKTSKDASFNIKISFPQWETDAYILLPACAYNGNRFRRVVRNYPPMYTADERNTDPQPLITDVPALDPDGSGTIEVTAGDMAVPCLGVFFPGQKEAAFVFTQQECKGKNIGFCVQAGSLELQFPALRSVCYRMCRTNEPSTDSGFSIEEGELVTSPVLIQTYPCRDIPDFFRLFFEHRKDLLSDAPAPNGYTKELWDIMEAHMNADNWSGEYYAEMSKKWQCGWVGGGMSSLPLLKYGSELTRERAIATIDYMTSHISPSGFFYSMIVNGEILDDSFGYQGMNRASLTRKNGDALYFLFKHFDIFPPKQAWIDAARGCADAFVRLYDRYGSFGQFVNDETGEMLYGGSTSGASAIGALVRAWQYFGDPRYLDTARKAGEQYYRDFVAKGYTCGGPGEALCCPDSESCYAMVESMMLLYEATQEAKWLRYAEDSVHLLSSWVMTYSYRFPEYSEFGRLGINTVGSVFANVQNKHSAPGLCTASGDAIYKLYKYTGRLAYLELLRDIAMFIPQCVSTEERPLYSIDEPPKSLGPGYICERVNTSDWESPRAVGAVFPLSCWCETSLLLSFMELMDNEEIRTALLS